MSYERPTDAQIRESVHVMYWLDGLRVMETHRGLERLVATCPNIGMAHRVVEALGYDAHTWNGDPFAQR